MRGVKIIFIILVVLVLLGLLYRDTPTKLYRADPTACTLEAQQCPDGSFVGRVGPECEFAACPDTDVQGGGATTTNAESTTVRINETIKILGVSLTPVEVVEDSRCPVDVVCVWAGDVRVRAQLSSGLGDSSIIFRLNTPITTETEMITLTKVTPTTTAGQTIAPESYRFTFTVRKR